MKHYHFYHKDTGVLRGVAVATDDDLHHESFAQANCPAECIPIEGRFDYRTQKVDITTGKIIPHVAAEEMAVPVQQLTKEELLAKLEELKTQIENMGG